jgi:ATP-dependent Clp protease protease subunit
MNKIDHFWNWARDADTGGRVMYLEGVIAESSWFDDDVTPAAFKEELFSGTGPISVYISSPGGDVVAASQIYTMLMEYPWDVTIKIHGIAASAASVVAMSGSRVLISPTGLVMLHNPFTVAIGDTEEMRRAIGLLDQVKESIINAYQLRTGLSRAKLARMLDAETWLSAHKAIELRFADGLLFEDRIRQPDDDDAHTSYTFSRRAVANSLLDRVRKRMPRDEPVPPKQPEPPKPEQPSGVPHETLSQRLLSLAR